MGDKGEEGAVLVVAPEDVELEDAGEAGLGESDEAGTVPASGKRRRDACPVEVSTLANGATLGMGTTPGFTRRSFEVEALGSIVVGAVDAWVSEIGRAPASDAESDVSVEAELTSFVLGLESEVVDSASGSALSEVGGKSPCVGVDAARDEPEPA